jgi:hypothetical protein
MTAKDKDTIYVDIDDEITGIIDKLGASEGRVVALVLPKRAATFQSIVNMKLLKRAADSSKKNLVLITSEAGLLPLAGAAGVHVAKTLTSKPEIPLAPNALDDGEETIQEDSEEVDTPPDRSKTIGQLASAGAAGAAADGVETLTLDDEDLPPEVADAVKQGAPGAKTFEPPKPKKNKKLRIPNFERFRLLLILGGLLLLLIIAGLIFITVSLPKATITIKTDATNVDANLNLNLSTAATALDPTNNILPSKLVSTQKTYTQQVPTTGQKNNGQKATGSVTMTAQECAPNLGTPATVPVGTGLSSNGLTYITQQDTTFSGFGSGKGNCQNYQATSSTPITAQTGGANYNGATGFTYKGRPDITSIEVSSSISGGTDSIVQIVNQNDITSAKSKITPSDSDLKQALQSQLKGDNYYPIIATYVVGAPTINNSANVGDIASTVTVTEVITYTMFGAHQSDINTLIDNNIKGQIDASKQSILDNGLANGVFNVNNISVTGSQLTLSTKATAGPALDVNTIKQQSAGKQAGAIKSQLGSNPDVTSVNVKFSPFWVSSAPKKTSRITVTIAKPTGAPKASSSSANKP